MFILDLIDNFTNFIWSYPLPVFILLVGIFMSFKLGFIQFRYMHKAFDYRKKPEAKEGDIHPFVAFCITLSATVGTGNVVGVTSAIFLGGPGAVFWMWIVGFFSMPIKYSEVFLSLKYREKDSQGFYVGGPMYYIRRRLNNKLLPILFCLCVILMMLFGNIYTQTFSISSAINSTFNIPILYSSIFITVIIAIIISGGIKRIARLAAVTIPFIILLYIIGGILVIISKEIDVLKIFKLIYDSAFSQVAVSGGVMGKTIQLAVQHGFRRAVFSNEAGTGTAPIAAATAINTPVNQGLMHMSEVIWDTIIINSITAIIIIDQLLQTDIKDMVLIRTAFIDSSGIGEITLTVCLIFFAFTTLIAWYYYGEKAVYYLFGERGYTPYKVLYLINVLLSSTLTFSSIWNIVDFLNIFMVLINSYAIIRLSGEIKKDTVEVLRKHQ